MWHSPLHEDGGKIGERSSPSPSYIIRNLNFRLPDFLFGVGHRHYATFEKLILQRNRTH